MKSNKSRAVIDGYEVTFSFANHKNLTVCEQIKQILLSSVVSSISKQIFGNKLAISDLVEYNRDVDESCTLTIE